ncbi:polysaccharide deacetylase family protein [Texcoconibacillus texcoconensis]|uniref:Peptidoglycan/xylan/chitin deacetylase (PgdA/CDA1 family) n=1 Tax=Texcoconibacillus texcoconensis TaxID=1095777 RepID=A0A840QPH8_9BACI|nr:polysaccharide deacetylase family protein [Texcoconibacillus texcoconensis]MBB5173275.1 peptidoglycan/xylan/chitin deacetylase (PgdA/CDA1 family) [Texcoconibacillus texcoconensis]
MKRTLSKLLFVMALFIGLQAIGLTNVLANDAVEQSWWGNDEEEQTEELPDLRGGSEYENRIQEPVPQTLLQQLYPDTVFLSGPWAEKKVAITFDDGPDPRFTPGVLEKLNEHNAAATFFLMGARAEANPDLARRIVEEGHDIGNHTYWHPDLVEEGSVDTLVNEVTKTEDQIAEITGKRTSLFRPPYGFLYEKLVEELADLQYNVIGWTVDSLDWQELPVDEITSNVVDNTHPGAIILMHDGGVEEQDLTNTIESLDRIIPELQEQGYEFVTVSELLNIPAEKAE